MTTREEEITNIIKIILNKEYLMPDTISDIRRELCIHQSAKLTQQCNRKNVMGIVESIVDIMRLLADQAGWDELNKITKRQ